jgi:gas vesicle protein
MIDPTDLLIGAGSGTVLGGLMVSALKFSAGRNLHTLDETLKALKSSIDELARDIRTLRETDIAQAKDIGALQEGQKALQGRVDGQGNFWREQFEEHRALVHDRMAQATHAMIEAAENAAKGKRK